MREIIHAGLVHKTFIERATVGFDAYAASVEPWTLERGEMETGVPGETIRELAHAYAKADKAQLCWTLGITEHHNAVDNVLSLINLALLTGHVGREGSGLSPLRGQNNVQGGGDMGAIPNKLPGFQDIVDDGDARGRFDSAYDAVIPPRYGMHLSAMFDAMDRGELRALYVMGENPAQSEADVQHARHLLESLDLLVVQDLFLTQTAELADVVLPAAAAWCEADGTVTNSERRVQRVRKAVEPPGEARDDLWILTEVARCLGRDWPEPIAEDVWDEVRSLSPMHRGMSYAWLEELGGIQWPCFSDDRLGAVVPPRPAVGGRARGRGGKPAAFSVVEHELPVDELDDDFPIRLTTGRRLDSYNTGVQSGVIASPLRGDGEGIDLSRADAQALGIGAGQSVRVTSRRGTIVVPARVDEGLRPGLAFLTFHFPDEADTNVLTINATDPKSGTAEFKATAVRVEVA